MPPLHRHQLAHLAPAGWAEILARPWDSEGLACLQHWAGHGLPLVVTVQPVPRTDPGSPIALGLAAPLAWQRRRFALSAMPAHIAWFSEFPTLAQSLPQLPPDGRAALCALQVALHHLGVRARVYGSAGWQQLTGLRHVHERSDLDLWLAVDDAAQADRAAALLQACGATQRLDGELVFPDGGAVAWREWQAWRAGRSRAMLVKRLNGAALERADDAAPTALAASTAQAAWPIAA